MREVRACHLPAELRDERRYEKHIPALIGEAVLRSTSIWKWRDSHVHVEHIGSPEAPVRMLLVHGAGGNSAAMWPYAAHLSKLGAHVTVADLPGYGKTTTRQLGRVRYGDWQQLLVDLVRKEDDERPLVMMGASMGGMLAYDAAAATGLASRLVVTCLLDPRDPGVRRRLTWHPALASMAAPAMAVAAGPLANVRVPIRWIADMRHVANGQGLVDEVIADKSGGGGRVPLGWMRSFLESLPLVEPERFTDTPVLMIHPGNDRWTPLEVSQPFFNRVAAEKSLVVLEGCGHFPVEQPGFTQMLNAVSTLLAEVRPHP
ncbi:alpha/beta hydrolase [Arthrobacter sp. zg-Y1219]|uniref:alpha/beta hydrolase n=1 Tax=Arthrobacter sp. zg-Y1219 TaxID=3049067 RepID=UPI0024C459A3|nr:alpha/beta hydrolase [Arthrobacter sp. zg-Y1219]MDK1358777.1 alpha/beta hydrolase [Arthrobacter sp. zg-Y1219]